MQRFQRIFQTRQQALDVYKTQLSQQILYVESFEGYSSGTEVIIELEIRETHMKIALNASVARIIGRKEVTELGFGTRPGLLLNVPITPDVVGPLRSFFLTEASGGTNATVRASSSNSESPKGETRRPREPLSGLNRCTPDEALIQVKNFIALAERESLYAMFNVRSDVDRKTLRSIYNSVVRTLHPDSNVARDPELAQKLGEAYQLFNEAYQILHHPIQSVIYQEVSKSCRVPDGMSLNAYKKWQSDYSMQNAQNIRMADELVSKAETFKQSGREKEATETLSLALKYDPYHERAREMMQL